jgi:hypothetical protein
MDSVHDIAVIRVPLSQTWGGFFESAYPDCRFQGIKPAQYWIPLFSKRSAVRRLPLFEDIMSRILCNDAVSSACHVWLSRMWRVLLIAELNVKAIINYWGQESGEVYLFYGVFPGTLIEGLRMTVKGCSSLGTETCTSLGRGRRFAVVRHLFELFSIFINLRECIGIVNHLFPSFM